MQGHWVDGRFVLASAQDERIRRLETKVKILTAGIIAVSDLIDESCGVEGLHQNGDLARWSTLRTGGRFEEWLKDFDAALEISETT